MKKMSPRNDSKDTTSGFLESLEPETTLTILILAVIGCVIIILNIAFCMYRLCNQSRHSRERNTCVQCRGSMYQHHSLTRGHCPASDILGDHTHVPCAKEGCCSNLSIGMPGNTRPFPTMLPILRHVNAFDRTAHDIPPPDVSVGTDNLSFKSEAEERQDVGLAVANRSSVGTRSEERSDVGLALASQSLVGTRSEERSDVGLAVASRASGGTISEERQDVGLAVACPSPDENMSVGTLSPHCSPSEFASSSDRTDTSLRGLFQISERSCTRMQFGKQVVSIAKLVGHHGDTLYLDNMDISLMIPEGAVEFGQRTLICLALNWDLSDNPDMTHQQSLVSPVVFVGPHGLKLKKDCTLSFRHCAFDPRQIRLMRSETDLTEDKVWEHVSDQLDEEVSCYFTQNECQVKINSFTLYTCIQQPVENRIGKKWLQIAVFACPLREEISHHQVRVYFLNKTPCALQWAIQNEANFGGQMVCPEKVFLFDGNELDMFAMTRYVSKGWLAIDDDQVERLSFLSIWHGHCPHISLCYKRVQDLESNILSNDLAIELSLNLYTYQTSREEDGEKIFIQVAEDRRAPFVKNAYSCRRHHVDEVEIEINTNIDMNPSRICPPAGSPAHSYTVTSSERQDQPLARQVLNSTGSSTEEHRDKCDTHETHRLKVIVNSRSQINQCEEDFLESADKIPRKVPHQVRQKLKMLLDPDKSFGSDWRDLAAKLELDQCIPKLERYESPTEKLLNYIENRDISVINLQTLFREIGREDCATELEMHTYRSRQRDPVENETSGFETSGFNTGTSGISGTTSQLYRGDTSHTVAKMKRYMK